MLFTYAILDTANQLSLTTVVTSDKDLLNLFQKCVGGFIQDLDISDKSFGIFCNEEGFYTCLANQHAAEFIRLLDPNSTFQNLHGNILFVGLNDGQEMSLDEEQLNVLRSAAQQLSLTIFDIK